MANYQSTHTGQQIDTLLNLVNGLSYTATQINTILEQASTTMSSKLKPGTLIASGTVTNSSSFSYTATQNCCVYFTVAMQANSSGRIVIKIDNVEIASLTSGEAISYEMFVVPIYLAKNQVLYYLQEDNRATTYKVFAV